MGDLLTGMVACGLLGLIGQGTRAVIGLSKANVFGGNGATQQSSFNAAYLVISLIVGFIAGVLAGLALGVIQPSVPSGSVIPDRQTLLGLIAAGYAGTDFIEATFAKLMPQPGTPDATASKTPVANAAANNNPNDGANAVQALTGTVQALTSHVVAMSQVQPATLQKPPGSPAVDLASALRSVLPAVNVAVWVPALDGAFAMYGLNTPLRVAAALGQFVAEAGADFRELRENMNYTASQLLQYFPHEVPDQATADRYAGMGGEAIGNLVYANKQGNGSEASGDGYRFRGGGLIQLTGRVDYEPFAKAVGMDLDQAADYVATAEGAAVSACWYLSVRGCLPLADQWRLTDLTEAVNGGARLGLATRIDYANRFRHAFGVPVPPG